jgi:predicted dehydrogenase
MKPIQTLILGLGRISSSLEKDPYRYHPCTHSGVLLKSKLRSHFQLRGIYDPNPEKIEEFQKDWKLKNDKILIDLKSISQAKFDLCIIASSSNAHFENFEFASKCKIPYIMLEKPVSLDMKEFQKMLLLQKRNRSFVWVNHERRYHPIYNFVRDIVKSEEYGKLKTIKASVLTSVKDPGISFSKIGGGPLLHDGTHAIDFLDYLLEAPPKIRYSQIEKFSKNSIEKRAIAVLEYPNEVMVFLEVGGERNYFQFELDIQTTKGRFVLSNDGHMFFQSEESTLYKGFRSLKKIPPPRIPKKTWNPWIGIYTEIIEHYLQKTNSIRSSLEANKRILGTIKNIYGKHAK